MPRYRFAWSNLPPKLLNELSAALDLRGDPADALRRHYGARPKTGFIQDAWPTLLELWLPDDARSREYVVDELQAEGLGRTEISVRSKRGQLDYLRSCRNAPTLREIVLAAFLVAGETSRLPSPAVRSMPASQEPSPARQESRQDSGLEERPHRRAAADGHASSLDDWVVDTLRQALGLSDVYRDPDGDIPIPRGSSVLFVRPHDGESRFLEIFAPILQGFQMSTDVYEAVNAINAQVPMAKATVNGDGTLIVLSAQLLTHTLSPEELMFSIDLVSGAADHFDTLLQKRFGGSTLLDDDDDAIEV